MTSRSTWALFGLAAVTAAVVATGVSRSQAQGTDGQPDFSQPRRIADQTAEHIADGDVADAFAVLKPHSIIPPATFDKSLEKILSNRQATASLRGELKGVEFIRSESLGKSLVRFLYLEKSAQRAMVWEVEFYKPEDKWIAYRFGFRSDVQQFYRSN